MTDARGAASAALRAGGFGLLIDREAPNGPCACLKAGFPGWSHEPEGSGEAGVVAARDADATSTWLGEGKNDGILQFPAADVVAHADLVDLFHPPEAHEEIRRELVFACSSQTVWLYAPVQFFTTRRALETLDVPDVPASP